MCESVGNKERFYETKKPGSVKRLLPYMKGYWKECILGPVFKLLEAIFELIVPLVTAKMIDVGIANRDAGYIWKMGGAMFVLAACGLAFALICQYYASACLWIRHGAAACIVPPCEHAVAQRRRPHRNGIADYTYHQ